ncbi:HaeIII restriction endonuclease [Keratinibaculum paraultunense]|uniref:HaeIII restriction endonuclease n=1 Tax=Keratinibaculum paraultunense TaxID=1278232 RepID=A0A4R3KWG3_9FIRM|nr:HaeIII family restriction endonuclease [Keratinibaculum paraultunense]QQY79256.1 HaeIII family restriction endonuclease [Keratinibaculum paraultunense]TCS89388.1 HaeIII restriction endonuclease [Keratinibaculum paraultunense]
MAKQVKQGKAFEYACLLSLYSTLKENQSIEIEDTNSYRVAKNFYDNLDIEAKHKLIFGANAAAKVILRLEPQLENPLDNIPLILTIQEDSAGIAGDVRDVLCIRKQNQWEIGISCKHNHSAVKHSRLSPTIDFGESWFNIPCSQEYFDNINPLFEELRKMRKKGMFWRELEDKEDRFYVPLLNAFIEELKRLDEENPDEIPKRLLSYLLGKNDFYKVIMIDRRKVTKIQAFSMYGTLNQNAGKVCPQVKLPILNMPSRFYDISFKPDSKNTILVVADGGWTISMRIHNASSRIEPSLKFDVQLVGVPHSLYTHHESWEI